MKVRIIGVPVLCGIICVLLCVMPIPNCDEFHKLHRSLVKQQIGRPQHRWKFSIKIYFKGAEFNDTNA
jgi:hypothetical protein